YLPIATLCTANVGIGAAARHEVYPPLGRRTVNTDPLPGSVTSPPIMRASLPSSTNARHAGHLSTRQSRVRRDNAEGCRRRRSQVLTGSATQAGGISRLNRPRPPRKNGRGAPHPPPPTTCNRPT